MALPVVSSATGVVVFPHARLTCPEDHGDSSSGLIGNYSSFSAHSVWVGREVPLANWFQGTGIRQKTNGQQVWLLCDHVPVGRPCSADTRPAPRLLALGLVYFLNTSVGKQRTEPAGTKAVCSTLSWQLLKELVSERTKGQERRTSLGREKLPGTQEDPGTHSFSPLGPNHQGPGVLAKTHAAREAGFGDRVGLTLSTWVRILCPETQCLLFTSVCLAPWRSPASELRVLPWFTCGLSSLHLGTFTWGQASLNLLLLCVLLGENLWWYHINTIVYHRPNL